MKNDKRMQAVLYDGHGRVDVTELAVPRPGPGQVLLKILASGVCGSDAAEVGQGPIMTASMIDGPHPRSGGELPVVLGHEFAGVVEELGAGVDGGLLGRLMTCGAGVSCGRCARCLAGTTNLCDEYYTLGYHLDGGLADYAVVPVSTLVDAQQFGITPDAAALGQPMAIAVHAVRRSRLVGGERAVVVGIGGIGAFLTYAACATGADVVASDIDPEKLDLAVALGANERVSADLGRVEDELLRTSGRPDVIFEVTGRAAVLRACLALLRPGGRLVQVGMQKGTIDLPLTGLTLLEQEIVGTSAHVLDRDLPRALELIAARTSGWYDVAPTVFPLSAVSSAGLRPLQQGRPVQVKTLFDPRIVEPRPAVY